MPTLEFKTPGPAFFVVFYAFWGDDFFNTDIVWWF